MNKKRFHFFCIILVMLVFWSGCRVFQPSVMLRTGKNYQYDIPSDTANSLEYQINVNDRLEFRLFSNDGFKLIDLSNESGSGGQSVSRSAGNIIQYLIDVDGNAKLPVLGKVKLMGLTVWEAQLLLEEKYEEYYKKPFVLLSVVNKRVILFPGRGGEAKVIYLTNNNTTLLEALALAGGISDEGKSRKIKVIRTISDDKHDVYLIDLSRISGLQQAHMVMQANDVIYVEPVFSPAKEILAELSPIVSVLSSTITVIATIAILKNSN